MTVADAKPRSVGTPLPFSSRVYILVRGSDHNKGEDGNEVPIGTTGEICGSSPLLMLGYYGKPEQSAQTIIEHGRSIVTPDGMRLLRTGDLGYVDDDGYLYMVDRKKDLIISGG